jgi:hypothetical protein
MKSIVTKDELEKKCKAYQETLGFFTKRELVGVIRKKSDVEIYLSNATNTGISFQVQPIGL